MFLLLQAAEKKSAVLDLSKHVDQRVRVKFTGGREGKKCSPYHVFHDAAQAREGEAWWVPAVHKMLQEQLVLTEQKLRPHFDVLELEYGGIRVVRELAYFHVCKND